MADSYWADLRAARALSGTAPFDQEACVSGPVLLNNVDHAELTIRVGHGAEFGDDMNQLPIVASEFEEAQREYPIVFRRDGDDLRALVLLGFDSRENLFLTESGWQARYVPAVQRRGPLSAGLQAGSGPDEPQVVIKIDPAHPRVSRNEGEPLFLEHGGNAPVLELMADALRTVHDGIATTRELGAAFVEAGLLKPAKLDVEVGGGRRYEIADVFIVDRAAIAGLEPRALHSLNVAGFLELAVFAAASLGNIGRLASLKRDKDGLA